MRNKYSIDERVGCIAVVDLDRWAAIEVEHRPPGLSRDRPDVVWFGDGRHVPRWKKLLGLAPTHQVWEVPKRTRRRAERVCRRLNREEER